MTKSPTAKATLEEGGETSAVRSSQGLEAYNRRPDLLTGLEALEDVLVTFALTLNICKITVRFRTGE